MGDIIFGYVSVREELENSKVRYPTIVHAVILSTLKKKLDPAWPAAREGEETLPPTRWFGCRARDWMQLAMLNPNQYYKAAKDLEAAKLIARYRSAEHEIALPLVYHALLYPHDGYKIPSYPILDENAVVFRSKRYHNEWAVSDI